MTDRQRLEAPALTDSSGMTTEECEAAHREYWRERTSRARKAAEDPGFDARKAQMKADLTRVGMRLLVTSLFGNGRVEHNPDGSTTHTWAGPEDVIDTTGELVE